MTHESDTATAEYTVVPLAEDTWDAFAELVERNNGVYGGCWCIGWHLERKTHGLDHRAEKERLVRAGEAHAAIVLDAVGALHPAAAGA